MLQLDLPGIESTVVRDLARACPAGGELARRTLRRLPPDRWALEWHLPWWLGQTFGLDAPVCADLVMGSVLGLVAIRLEDDLLDGDLEPADRPVAARLSGAALDAALATFGRLLPPSSAFWPAVDLALQEWRAAGSAGESGVESRQLGLEAGSARWPGLASRGAPLRIPALATCLLAARTDAWPLVERCLGHAVTALVQYDQVRDWEADLAGGRWNAFVAAHSGHPQVPEWRDRNRIAVLVALLTRGAAAEAYARIEAEIASAASLAAAVGCRPLVTWLRSYANRTASQGEQLERHYERAADRAVELVFGPPGAGG